MTAEELNEELQNFDYPPYIPKNESKASTIIEKAKSFIGTTESPPNSNNVIFNTDYYGHPVYGASYPWCMTYVWDIFRMCGASNLFYGGNKTASCPCLMEWAKSIGQFVTGSYRPGDVLFFNFDSVSDADHTGFCECDNGSYVTTIEGNTSSNNYGSQSNGGGVFERTRSKSVITGAYRPKYDVENTKQDSDWVKTSKGWRYLVDGQPVRNQWVQYKDKWYYLKANGYMATDEYIRSSSYKVNELFYYVDKDGAWNNKSYKWVKNSKGWKFKCVETGKYVKSRWIVIDNKKYFTNSDGYMVHGRKFNIHGVEYTFNDDGTLKEN